MDNIYMNLTGKRSDQIPKFIEHYMSGAPKGVKDYVYELTVIIQGSYSDMEYKVYECSELLRRYEEAR